MIRSYRLFAPGMGVGFLPDPGGALDQSCWLMDAFGVVGAADAELQDAGDKGGDR